MHSFRPPVILVPGIMGSCSEVGGISYPLLHREYPARQDSLKLFHPYLDVVGWNELQKALFPVGFTLYAAPWDWRMPVIRPDEYGKVAWKELQWIGTTNEIRFDLQLASSGSNPLALITELPAPQNLWSFPSDGTCGLAWQALTNANVAAYRVYARRKDESLFSGLGTVTNSPFSTGHSWATSASETNWFYAVVAVSTNGAESPYEDTVMNYVPTLAKFSADVAAGTPPLYRARSQIELWHDWR